MDNNNLRDPRVPYAAGGVPQSPNAAPTPLFADAAHTTPPAPLQPAPPPAAMTSVVAAPLPPATPPVPATAAPLVVPSAPKKLRDWRKIILTGTFSALFLLFIGAGWLIFQAIRTNNAASNQVNSQIAETSIPLSEFASSGSLNLLGTQSLAVNGQLRANESFVLAPQAQPARSERGQLYFDANTNRLAYYNGNQFIQVPGDKEEQVSVLTLQGQSGDITLVGGIGLAVSGTTLTNTGVTALGGATGDITLGAGVTIVDGTLANTGLLGATAGAGISISNDGAGNITISNSGAGTGTVNSPNGTAGRIAKFTGVQTIEDSLLSEAGSAVTVNGGLNITGSLGLSSALGVNNGGTGATSLAANGVVIGNGSGALTAVTAGGVGECLMSTAGAPAFQACPGGGGGGVTALNGLAGSLTIANATAAGSTITLNDASTSQKGIAQFDSTNFSASGGVINTIQDIAIAATPTFGRLSITSSQATSPMLLVNNTNAGGTGNLIDLQLNGTSRLAVSPAGNMTLTGTLNGQTISSAASFSGSLAVTGAANLNGGASVTGTLAANTVTPTSAMTVGATNQSLTLQGNASTTFNATNSANTTTLSFQTPTANVNYRLLTAAAGTYDICTTAANCAGVGGGVTTAGGTTNRVPKFTGSQTLGDSIITDNGTTVTIGGILAVNTITPTGALTVGSNSQSLALQGTTTTLGSTSGGITNTLNFATPSGGNKTITLPNASGTVAVSASGPLSVDANGNITCATCVTSGGGGGGVGAVDSLNGLTGALTIANASAAGSTITINDASTSQKGIAQFDSTNFSASSGTINTIQNINTSAAPQFGQLTLSSSQASAAMLTVNNTNVSASGNLIDLQLNGSSRFAVTPAGAMVVTGTINGQTVSSSASFTGTLAVAGAANLNGGASVTGTLTTNTITPTGALTVGATNQSFLVQGNASSTITATSGANTTTLAFQSPTASVTYRLLTAAAGTYDLCTTVGNCAGVGGGVTTAGGTTGTIALFTGSNAIGNSIITQASTTITVAGTLAVTSLGGGITTAIDVSDSDIGTALNFGSNDIVGTTGNIDMTNFDVTGATGATTIGGALTVNNTGFFQAGSDSTTAFNVRSSGSNNMFTVNTSNGSVGINLGGNVTPSLTNGGLQVQGGIRLSGTSLDTFTTPHITSPSSLGAKLNIEASILPAFSQQIAVGVSNASDDRARGITVFDARSVAHQPSLAVVSPDENNIMGFSWDGSNTIGYIKNSAANIGINVAGSDIANFNTSAVSLLQNSTVAANKSFTVTSGLTSLTGATTGDALAVSNSTSTGNIAVFKDNATAVTTIADGGAATFQNAADSTGAFRILNSAGAGGVSQFAIDTTTSRVYIGNPTADGTGALLVLDTKNTAADPTGVNGAMYYNSAMGTMRCYTDGAWRFCNEPLGLSYGYNITEDFMADDGNGMPGQYHWDKTLSGTGSGVNTISADVSSRPGQVQLETGTTASGWGGMYLEPGGTEQIIIGGGEVIEMAVNLTDLAVVGGQNYDVRLGLCDEDEIDCADGLYFEYDRNSSANWRYGAANDGNISEVSSSKAVATGWTTFRIVVTSTTTADFYVKNAGETTWTNIGTLTSANFPLTAAHPTRPEFTIVKEEGLTERIMKVDYFNMRRMVTDR